MKHSQILLLGCAWLGALGYLDPASGLTRHIHLGTGAAPHGVIVGPDGAPCPADPGTPRPGVGRGIGNRQAVSRRETGV